VASLAAGSSIVCPITVTMPGTAGGTDTTQTSVGVDGATSAGNDGNTANNTTSVSVDVVDAVNDSANTPFGTAITVNVLTNDQNGATPATTTNVVITQTVAPTAGSNFDPATGNFSVPNNAAPGTYTVTYQICQLAGLPPAATAACDTATATIVVGPSADMSVAITGLPTAAGPGAVLNGTLTCSNAVGGAAATNPTCTAVAGTPAGATVTVGTCAPALPVASLAAGSSIVCPITVTMPGTAGGTDTTQTSVGVTGTTSATNDANTANDSTNATINVIDAIDDSTTTPFATATTVNVLTNDQNAATGATTANVSISVVTAATAGSNFDPATGNFSVPNNAAPGTYTVTYRICAVPATTPVACDTATATIVVGPAADMSVAITGLPTAAGPGAVLNGTLTCSNAAGGAAATNPTCAAAAGTPAGATVAVGACTPALPVASLAAGASIVCPITVTMPGTAGGTDTTQTSVGVAGSTGAANDGNTANDTTSVSLNVVDAVDDSVTTPFGTAATINVLGNDGNGGTTATTANVTITVVTVATTGSTFDPATGVFSVPANAPPATYTVTYQICANPAVTPAACDTATATIIVAPAADLAIQKNGPAAVAGGGIVIYTLNLINNGLSAANGATFSDTLPAGLTGITATCTGTAGSGTSPCGAVNVNVAGNVVSGLIPAFPSGGSVIITIRATAPASGTLVNTATISPPPGVPDPDLTNNTSTVSTNIGTPPLDADLSVMKVGPAVISPMGTVTYVIDVVNAGPGAADGALFTDTVPAAISGVTWTCSATGPAVCPAASGSGNTISQTIATFGMNGKLRYIVTGLGPVAGPAMTNTATVAVPPGVTDPNPGNNTSSVTTTITASPPSVNLSMSKVGPATVLPFGTVSYTLVATNNGPIAADGATVSDTFPSVLTGVTWTCTGSFGTVCGAASGSGNLNLTLTTFPAGGQATIRVTGTAPASGTFQNSARVTTPPSIRDSDPTDDIGGPVITTVLLGPADLITTVTIPTAPVMPGQPVVATVTMGNIGPTPAGNVTVTLQLPPGSTAVVPSNGGSYNPVTGLVTWPLIPFVPANTNPIATYTVTFTPPVTGGTLTSNVRTPDTEVTLTNNPASVSLRVELPADEPVPVPVAPWWAAALMLVFVARRALRNTAERRAR